MAKPTKTTNPIHFTDLGHERFEDLCMQLVFRLHRWEDINHDGRAGGDEGVDIRAIQRLDDNSLRHWYVQCRRYKKAGPRVLKGAVDDALAKAVASPDVLLVVIACNVSLKARKAYEEYAAEKGVEAPLLWPASKLEATLYSDHPDLLFTFFGISLARQERSKESSVKRNLAMKRKLRRVLNPGCGRIIIRSIDDDEYPEATSPPEGRMSGWFRSEFHDFYYGGIELALRIEYVMIDRTDGRWAVVDTVGIEFMPVGEEQEDVTHHYKFHEHIDLERYDIAKAFRLGRIPYRNIVECDEEGDEYYNESHLYCKYDFAKGGEPYEDFVFKIIDGFTLEPEKEFPFDQRIGSVD